MPRPDSHHTTTFSQHRDALFGIAYRMLGSRADAEDVVQSAWLRWNDHADDVNHPTSWLSRTVTRLSIDTCRKAYRHREEYVGPWLPEPLYDDTNRALADTSPTSSHSPERTSIFRESIELGFLRCLELLGPLERAAYILREVYGLEYTELAAVLERTQPACRKLVSRAKAKMREERTTKAPTGETAIEETQAWMGNLLQAIADDDVQTMKAVLLDDTTLLTDSDGKRAAARRPVVGAANIIAFFRGLARQYGSWSADIIESNGVPTVVVSVGGQVESVIIPQSTNTGIHSLFVYRNPEKFPSD